LLSLAVLLSEAAAHPYATDHRRQRDGPRLADLAARLIGEFGLASAFGSTPRPD
jgi:hypothetical protein